MENLVEIANPPLVAAFLEGRALELLSPVRFLGPDELPTGTCRPAAPERAVLAGELLRNNEAHGHPAAGHLAESLSDPSTRVVITGQQPGLFGGPLYTLSKAIATVLWAEKLQAAGEQAVPLFWMATEDHDFRETSRATFISPKGLETVDLGDDNEPLVPVGMRAFGAGIEDVFARLRRDIPGDRFETWLERLGRWYGPEDRFGEAFAGLMVALLGERCPLLVDARLAGLKQAQRPWMRQVIEERDALAAAFSQRDREIEASGFALQVRPQPGTSPLFLQQGRQRRRIEWRDEDRFGLRGDPDFSSSVEDLLAIVEGEPERLSPGVRARSAIQDAVFGTCLQVLGPGELSYMPQAAPLFELLEIPSPWVALRPQVLVLDDRQRQKIEAVEIELGQLLDPRLDADAWLARPEDTAHLEGAKTSLEEILLRLRDSSLELDETLENPWQKTADQMRRALEAFSGRVTAAAARQHEVSRQRLESLREICLPAGQPQERVISVAHFPGKYGREFVEAMFEQMHLDPRRLHIVSP